MQSGAGLPRADISAVSGRIPGTQRGNPCPWDAYLAGRPKIGMPFPDKVCRFRTKRTLLSSHRAVYVEIIHIPRISRISGQARAGRRALVLPGLLELPH